MYRQSKGVGFVAYPGQTSAGQRMYQGPRKQFLAEAAGAIPAGMCVVMGNDGAGRTVTQALATTASHATALAGLYEGEGGTGLEVAATPGRYAAVAKDLVWLTIHGNGKALVTGLTVANLVPNATLTLRASTNDLTDVALVAGAQGGILLLETMTVVTQSLRNVWVRLT